MSDKIMQKILIVHNYYQIPGGEDTVVANEKKMLENHGHEVLLYSRNNFELKSMSKVKKFLLPFTTVFSLKTYREVRRIIKEQNIDVIHVHNTLSLISPSVYYAAFSCKVPVVQTIHNFRLICPGAMFYRDGHICEDCVEHGLGCAVKHSCYRGSKLQTLMCVINTKIHRMLGTYGKLNYICLTEFTKDKLISLKQIKKDNIYIKPNFAFEAEEKKADNADRDYYLFVGRIEEIKGVNILIDAFKDHRERKLVIAGKGSQENQIQRKLEEEHIENIELVGFKTHDEINYLMSNASALIMCSQWYETFGMVIIEAYSNETPVIAGNIGNIKDLVLEGKTGEHFIYNSSKSLNEAIYRFENNTNIAYGKNAYEFFKNNFTSESNYSLLKNIYQKVKA